MLQTHYNWLRWDCEEREFTVDMEIIKGMEFTPASEDECAMMRLDMGMGVHYIMFGEHAERFREWRWATASDGGFRVGDLNVP